MAAIAIAPLKTMAAIAIAIAPATLVPVTFS